MLTDTSKDASRMSYSKAQATAGFMNQDEAGDLEAWTYNVTPLGNLYLVEVSDEDGIFLGFL